MPRPKVTIPPCFADVQSIEKNPVRQILIPVQEAEIQADENGGYSVALGNGRIVPIIRDASDAPTDGFALKVSAAVYRSLGDQPDLSRAKWLGQRDPISTSTVLKSLEGSFSFKVAGNGIDGPGLRAPQIGAVHSVLGFWTTGNPEPATVVMPTGTGKTETMLALFAVCRPKTLLVLVPSDALRLQIAEKFESFGVLQKFGVVAEQAHRPAVGQIRHSFKLPEDALAFAESCNVMVSTPQSLFACSPETRSALFQHCSHLFVDEAHHVPANTWRQIRDEFSGKPVVQFTATPFREDGRHLGGRLIYAFPLREAQAQGYFSNINFVSVLDLGDHDQAVATRAVDQLKQDLDAGLDHLVMARVSRTGRASELLSIYEALAPEYQPVVLHSSQLVRDRREARRRMDARESRIVICVNMLGEGFDLPALKIAAIHDPHKSLGVTLQFVGRFARTVGLRLGDATVVVGRPDRDFDRRLRRLYAEDADWNRLVRDLSEGAVREQQEASDFDAGFGSLPDEVTMRSLLPRMSTVVYKTNINDWDPESILELFPPEQLLTFPIAVNQQAHVAWFVTENRSEVKWGELRTVEEVTYDLYVLFWDRSKQLLYVNSSNTGSHHQELARAVGGDGCSRIIGETVYRVMANINRLVPTNVGVLDVRNRSRRFSMHVGADVSEGFPIAEAQTKTQTNIFAYGYEDGNRVSIGASLKGRVWSYRIAATLKQWTDWCNHIGAKLTDSGISVDEVMRNFIRPTVVEDRPLLVPLALKWPWQIYANMSEELRIEVQGVAWPLVDVDLVIGERSNTGPIDFRIETADWSVPYRLDFQSGSMTYTPLATDAKVLTARSSVNLSEFFNHSGLTVYMEQDAQIEPPGILIKPDRTIPPFDPNELVDLTWEGTLLNVESQGQERRSDSVQARMLKHVDDMADWSVILDDDGNGEIADIVALRKDEENLYIHLTHCKYVHGGRPRAQVGDLYEVCGQAQKSVIWRRNIPLMLDLLIRREKSRLGKSRLSGFMKGDAVALYALADAAPLLRPHFTIALAQPGLKKSAASNAQLDLLASTELYLHDVGSIFFEVYCSP